MCRLRTKRGFVSSTGAGDVVPDLQMAAEPFAAAPASLGSAPAVGLEPREGATVERLEVEDVSEEGNPEEWGIG